MCAAGGWVFVLADRRADLAGWPNPKGVYIRANLYEAYRVARAAGGERRSRIARLAGKRPKRSSIRTTEAGDTEHGIAADTNPETVPGPE